MAMSETESITITIDGQEIAVARDTTILKAAKELGIEIPTLCFLDLLGFYGACRVCLVEITQGEWQWLDAACVFPIRRPISVSTNSENVRRARKMVLELLLARCPDSEEVKILAKEYGVEGPSYKLRENPDDCILCGLCVRVCMS